MTADTITLVQSRYLILSKTIHADGRVIPYGNAKMFDLHEVPVNGLDALRELLADLLPRQWFAATFGGIADPTRTQAVRRLAHADPETGDQPTLRAVAHRWCALGLDGVARPESVAAHDLPACAALAVRTLPAAFHGARSIAQASASHGIKPGCRLRLWFWFDRTVTGKESAYGCYFPGRHRGH